MVKGFGGDGNFKLAKRVAVHRPGSRFLDRPFTVVLGWTGTDGSLLKPVAVQTGETVDAITADLEPLLDKIKAARLAAGFEPWACAPVFHATDNYRAHCPRLTTLYNDKSPEVRTHVQASTPLGNSAGAAAADTCPTRITGDPRHDVIALRRLVPPACNDWRDFIADHTDVLNRLSAPIREPRARGTDGSPPPALAPDAVALLQTGVEQSADAFRARADADPVARSQVRALLQHPAVLRAGVWQQAFHALPPRGTLERLASRLRCSLHPAHGFFNDADMAAFKQEVRRIWSWYKPGRRSTRARRGILRTAEASSQVCGLRSVCNGKVKLHYARLLKPKRLEGLFAWREIAVALRGVGIPVQSGTVSVERLWSSLMDMFPAGARTVTPAWFKMCSAIAFLRYNYRHVHADRLPTWSHGDAILAERLQDLAMIMPRLASDNDSVALLSRPFQPAEHTPAASGRAGSAQ